MKQKTYFQLGRANLVFAFIVIFQAFNKNAHCSPIQGTIFIFLVKDLVLLIGEQQDFEMYFSQFFRQPDILDVPGNLLELHDNVYFFCL